MRLPEFITSWLRESLIAGVALRRNPDFIIGDHYLERWWIIPRNPVFNLYLHRIAKSDDDRALHDHPWWNVSVILMGEYLEHLPHWQSGRAPVLRSYEMEQPDGPMTVHVVSRREGEVVPRLGKSLHRLELPSHLHHVWSLFITGPRFRSWGFACPKGWRHWRLFTGDDKGQVGRGCD